MNGAAARLKETGDLKPLSAEELLPVVYDELRKLAAARMAHEAPGQTLQPTALVHEAWIRLSRSERQQWRSRAHFFGAAAEAMRRILIDRARSKASQKRSGEHEPFDDEVVALGAPSKEVLAVHEALDVLAAEDKTAAEVVKLRYFIGMTIPEIATALELAPRTVDRHWSFARAWLKCAIRGEAADTSGPESGDQT
ncbi:MAG TPA: ECF-type sigma factor [Verrucomicrobiae bacterium]|nr:ECF-type sigma factor [Verrucomicrobiae bacterium]